MHPDLLIKDFLNLLSENEQTICALCHEGFTVIEIADKTGYSASRVYEIIENIRKRWSEYELRG
jgi:DNA-binding NarL/FixJ family response regulator